MLNPVMFFAQSVPLDPLLDLSLGLRGSPALAIRFRWCFHFPDQ